MCTSLEAHVHPEAVLASPSDDAPPRESDLGGSPLPTLMIDRYTRPEMGALWTEDAQFQAWLDVELAACWAW